MKPSSRKSLSAAVLGLTLVTANITFAQTTIQETTTSTNSAGTISEFGPETMVIRSTTSPEPLRYRYSKTTTYVDETGAPVSIETVKSGLPVTVYYTRVGDQLVASRVIVKRAAVVVPAERVVVPDQRVVIPAERAVVPAAPVIEKKTTTTTTTTTDKNEK